MWRLLAADDVFQRRIIATKGGVLLREPSHKITVRVFYDGREVPPSQLKDLVITSPTIDRIINSVADRGADIIDDTPPIAS